MMAMKRRDRMLNRGVDLVQINMVKKKKINDLCLRFCLFISNEIMERY